MRRNWRTWSELAHPHALPASDYGETNDALYVATPWVSGPSLRAVLDQRRTLDAAEIRTLAEQLGGALDAAVGVRLIHLDVKPENVLFASDDGTGHAYVTDFGAGRLAAWQAGLDRSPTFRGTLEYAAPEQIQGGSADRRTVVYSLGCLLYEALTGVTPYGGRSPDALLRAHLEEAPPPVERGAAVDSVFATALANRRDERYATCTELAGALCAALACAPAPRRARGAWRRRRVLRSAAVAASAGAVAAGAAAAALTLGGNGGADPARDTRLGLGEFLAAIPGSGPSVNAAQHPSRAAPTAKHVATRKAHSQTPASVAKAARPTPERHRAAHAPKSAPPAIASPRVKHHASSPAVSRGSEASSPRPETTTPAAAPTAPLPPPLPPADPTPPLPPPPP